MAENQGQTIAAPVTNQPAHPQTEAQQTTPMWASPQLNRPGQEASTAGVGAPVQPLAPTAATGSMPAAPVQPMAAAGAPVQSAAAVQQYPYGASNPPPMTFEVPQEQLNPAGPATPAAGGGRMDQLVNRLKTPMAAAIIGGVLLLGIGFAAGYVVGHDVGSSSTSSTTSDQSGFGGMGGTSGQMPGGSTGQSQGGTGTMPFDQGQSQTQPFGQDQQGGTSDGTTSDDTTNDTTTDLSQTQ